MDFNAAKGEKTAAAAEADRLRQNIEDLIHLPEQQRFREVLGNLPVAVYITDNYGRITYYNDACVKLAGRRPELGTDRWCVTMRLYWPDGRPMPHDECPMAVALKENRAVDDGEAIAERPDGTRVPFLAYPRPLRDSSGALTGAINTLVDISARQRSADRLERQTHRLQLLNRIAQLVARDLDIERIAQSVADATTELTGAQFGAFFYNVVNSEGNRVKHFAVSGAARGHFEKFGVPRDSSLFGRTFRGEGAIRCDDVRTDPRYGNNPPYCGLPEGHLPVVSYLAVPVVLHSGETLGALCFGHERAGIFDEGTEDLVAGVAAHAATAIDNARLYEAAQSEVARSRRAERAAQQLAAIVKSSDDAIVSKDTNGIIQTWNKGAQKLFGYRAEEVIGKSVTILIPPDRDDEEPMILARIRRGEAVDHYETVRQRKDGSLVDISLTVSPIHNSAGKVIGASKIARDISERRAAEAHRELLLREVNHRAKNMLHNVQSIAVQTLHNAKSQEAFKKVFLARLTALSHAHDLLARSNWRGASLAELVALELAPYRGGGPLNWTIDGCEVELEAKTALALGMAFHELATNAAKYGALSTTTGRLEIRWRVTPGADGADMLHIDWTERAGPLVSKPSRRGFGSRLIEHGLAYELEAEVRLAFEPEGVNCTIDMPLTPMEMETLSEPSA
ncbi:MAG TPA: PAS domain S-box protein [Gammaproteobacteria bacterium]|nr:PAS domain S-box protein [Gammaproteobacteria bacterium]